MRPSSATTLRPFQVSWSNSAATRPMSAVALGSRVIRCRATLAILKVKVMLSGPVSHGVAASSHRGCRLMKLQPGGHMQRTETKGLEEKLE